MPGSLPAPLSDKRDLDLPPAATPAERSVHRAAVASRGNGGRRPVLVVDRSAIARRFLVQKLESLGYDVQGAESGEQALGMTERGAFAIVFVELVLDPVHGIDGLDLCQAIKQKHEHPRGLAPKVVIVSGLASPSDRVRSALAGCDVYLTKPLAEANLMAALTEVDPLFK